MRLSFNGSQIEVPDGTTLLDFVTRKGVNPKVIVVEHNREIVKQEDWGKVELNEGDNLQIVTFVGGG